MENRREESLLALNAELKKLEKERRDMLYEGISNESPNLIWVVTGLVLTVLCGLFFGGIILAIVMAALYLFLHAFTVIFNGWAAVKSTSEYKELVKQIVALDIQIDELEKELLL